MIASALVIAGADAAFQLFSPSLALAGALDEPAHAATTIIILGALGWLSWSAFGVTALIASVAIDLDHIPQYLGDHFLTAGTPRPYPHSLLTLVVVALVSLVVRGRGRAACLGIELGLAGHFFRDMAEPSSRAGVALLWPLSDTDFRISYVLYAALLGLLVVVALWRASGAQGARPRMASLSQ